MESLQPTHLSPLLQKVILWLESVGEVIMSPDGHLFFQPRTHIKCLWGAMDSKKEGEAAGMRIIVRKVHKRARNSKYTGMPWYQIYVLPIVKKGTSAMTDAEHRNMELNRETLHMAHAIERDPEKAAAYHELHEAHKRNPAGYPKIYPNFFGFPVATFRMQLAAGNAVAQMEENDREEAEKQDVEKQEGASSLTHPLHIHGIHPVRLYHRARRMLPRARPAPLFIAA